MTVLMLLVISSITNNGEIVGHFNFERDSSTVQLTNTLTTGQGLP